ncbi:hypothetical protein ACOMHN_043128 [Nucella lapillus]
MLRFFVGQNDDWDKIITPEQDIHGDVIRTEYMDAYANLSYKVLAAMFWALRNVGSVQHVMKIDDDTYVNLPFLLSELRDISVIKDATQLYVIGAVCVSSSVVRDEGNKWFVSHLDYPSDVYPTYVFGGVYVMTKSAAAGILAASARADYLHLEDVFVNGHPGQICGGAPPASPRLPHSACLTPPASPRLPHSACLTPPASLRLPHSACLTPPASLRLPHSACLTPPASPRLPHSACLTPPASPRLPHPACLTPPALLRLPHPAFAFWTPPPPPPPPVTWSRGAASRRHHDVKTVLRHEHKQDDLDHVRQLIHPSQLQ